MRLDQPLELRVVGALDVVQPWSAVEHHRQIVPFRRLEDRVIARIAQRGVRPCRHHADRGYGGVIGNLIDQLGRGLRILPTCHDHRVDALGRIDHSRQHVADEAAAQRDHEVPDRDVPQGHDPVGHEHSRVDPDVAHHPSDPSGVLNAVAVAVVEVVAADAAGEHAVAEADRDPFRRVGSDQPLLPWPLDELRHLRDRLQIMRVTIDDQETVHRHRDLRFTRIARGS